METLFTHAEIDLDHGPDWTFEASMLRAIGAGHDGFIAGVDEVGRGPLSGPVVAAAVILNPDRIPVGLDDSKKLSHKKREALYDLIMAEAVATSIVEVPIEVIDDINILQASLLAMRQAVQELETVPVGILVDGNKDPNFESRVPTQTLVKGDGRSLSIAAASIIAKVYRDRLMQDLASQYPGYGWETNAGYGSKKHREAIISLGITPHHRKTFSPVKEMLEK